MESSLSVKSGEPELMHGDVSSKLKSHVVSFIKSGLSYIIPVPGNNSN